MSMKSKLALIALSTMIALYIVVGGLLSNNSHVLATGDPYIQLKIFGEVLRHITRDYVDEPDLEKVRVGALRGLADGLDPYSAYLTPEQVNRFTVENTKRNPVGATFSKVGRYLYVVAVLKDSPAEKAGLRSGDFIEYVGQSATQDVSLYDIQETLAALSPNQEIEFTVLRRGGSEKVKVKAGQVGQPMIESRIEEGEIGYIRITSLTQGKAAEVKANIAALSKKGMKKLVLDLRGAASGELTEGVAVANLFLPTGTLARVIGHHDEIKKTFEADPANRVFDGQLVVVINRTTAGPAEVIAASVLAAKRGEVVGERTFGAGSEQELFRMQDGAGLYLTVAKYAPMNGKPFMEEPVKPTVEVKSTDLAAVTPDGDDDSTQSEEQNPTQTPAQPDAQKPAEPATKAQTPAQPVDQPLKKALELLKGKSAISTAEKKAA